MKFRMFNKVEYFTEKAKRTKVSRRRKRRGRGEGKEE